MSYINQVEVDGTDYYLRERYTLTSRITKTLYVDCSLTEATGNAGTSTSTAIYYGELQDVINSFLLSSDYSISNLHLNIYLYGTLAEDIEIGSTNSIPYHCGVTTDYYLGGGSYGLTLSGEYDIYVYHANCVYITNYTKATGDIYIYSNYINIHSTISTARNIIAMGNTLAEDGYLCYVYIRTNTPGINLTCQYGIYYLRGYSSYTLNALTATSSLVFVDGKITVSTVESAQGGTVIQNGAFLT